MGSFEPLGGGLDHVLQRALARDPKQRYSDGSELAAALRAPESAHPVRTTDEGTTSDSEDPLWMRAVAMIDSVATAAILWTLLRSVTPRVVDASEPAPLIAIRNEVNGQLVERARFETWPTLGALVLVALAVVSHAALYAHWRRSGPAKTGPDQPLANARTLLTVSLVGMALYGARLWAESAGWDKVVSVVPVLGGGLELFGVFVFWSAFLEGARSGRSLWREPRLITGVLLCLVPPVAELARFLSGWTP